MKAASKRNSDTDMPTYVTKRIEKAATSGYYNKIKTNLVEYNIEQFSSKFLSNPAIALVCIETLVIGQKNSRQILGQGKANSRTNSDLLSYVFPLFSAAA